MKRRIECYVPYFLVSGNVFNLYSIIYFSAKVDKERAVKENTASKES
jgi:hypothetical protein